MTSECTRVGVALPQSCCCMYLAVSFGPTPPEAGPEVEPQRKKTPWLALGLQMYCKPVEDAVDDVVANEAKDPCMAQK